MDDPQRRGTPTRPERAVEIEPVKSTRIYEEIVRQVKTMIAEGRLKSGDRLPPERDLAEKFVVSRTSVREALRALETLGLLEIRAGEGTFVRATSVDALVEPLALAMASQREAIAELFEARRILEPAIAALAAERATPDDVREMDRILAAQSSAVAAGGSGVEQDARFHAAIATAAHNRTITLVVNRIMDVLTQSREESLSAAGRPERSHHDHRQVFAAITGRDPDAARRAMLEHLLAVERLVREAGERESSG
jgi:GntR family transcriptional repressor for pyruvate dehydrogenase complex